MIVKSLKYLTILFSCIILYDRMIVWHMMLWLCIQLTWHQHVNYLTLDIWHWYLTYYHLTPDTWHLISYTKNLYAITWYMTLATWCWYTWPDVVTPNWNYYTWHHVTFLFMIITFTGTWHDYYTATRVLLYSWTHVSHVLMSQVCYSY